MKAFILFFFISIHAFSQCDSILIRLDALENRGRIIQLNLTKFRKQERTGFIVTTIGAVFTGLMISSFWDHKGVSTAYRLAYFGGAVTLSGIYISMDAHKFISRAVDYYPSD